MRRLSFALALSCACVPAEKATDVPAVDAPEAPTDASTDRAGIGIEGRWTVEVRDSEGLVVEHREFHNDYTDTLGVLVATLTGQNTRGTWALRAAGPMCGAGGYCYSVDPANAESAPAGTLHFTNLTLTPATNQVTLAGSFTASAGGAITHVETLLGSCPSEVPQNLCRGYGVGAEGTAAPFTSAALSPTIAVLANQTVYMSVVLAFAPMTP